MPHIVFCKLYVAFGCNGAFLEVFLSGKAGICAAIFVHAGCLGEGDASGFKVEFNFLFTQFPIAVLILKEIEVALLFTPIILYGHLFIGWLHLV